MSESEQNGAVVTRRPLYRIVGMILFSAFVVSCFLWGPLGLIYYVGGLFNSFSVFLLTFPFVLLIPLGIIFLPVLAIVTLIRWRRFSDRAKVLSSLLIVALLANATSLGLGLAGMALSPFDMFVRGFTRYAENRTDVAAIRTWLGTLDPNEYAVEEVGSDGMPLPVTEWPPAIVRLNPNRYPLGVRVGQDDAGKLKVRLMWGGGFIGHWGIEVGDKSMQPPADSETVRHRPLAPGAWVWSNST